MGAVKWLLLFLKHPLEFKTFIQFHFWYHWKWRKSAWKEHPNSGWDRQTMRRCWELLEVTDKGFCAAIKGLEGDLPRTMAILFLVLRGLDTIEDDMTLPDAVKQLIMRSFHIHTVTPGWKFDGCGPDEKHRKLLMEYDNVVEEVNLLSPQYKSIIIDSISRIETGLADCAHKAATTGSIYLETVAEYDRYCHYAAGILAEAVSRIYSASEGHSIGIHLELSNSVALFLQKRDIIGDYREDVDQRQYFWPREIWGREEYGFKEMIEMCNKDPDTMRHAAYVQSEMILDALRHITDVLDYLWLMRDRTLFNPLATTTVLAFAVLELYFMNKEVFQRKIDLCKVAAAKLIMRSTNMKEVVLIFREYTRKIRAKAVRSDPSFIGISNVCEKIEERCEGYSVEKLQTTKISTRTTLA